MSGNMKEKQSKMADGLDGFSDGHKRAGYKVIGTMSGAPKGNDGEYKPGKPKDDKSPSMQSDSDGDEKGC